MNNDTASKTINLVINSTKITNDVLKNAIQQYLSGDYSKRGKVSLNELAKGGKIEAIEISKSNIADFRRIASKYDVQYALSKCADKSAYYVLFSASKAMNIEKAFREYASMKVKTNKNNDFSREAQRKFKEQAIKLTSEYQKDIPDKFHKHEKVIER